MPITLLQVYAPNHAISLAVCLANRIVPKLEKENWAKFKTVLIPNDTQRNPGAYVINICSIVWDLAL